MSYTESGGESEGVLAQGLTQSQEEGRRISTRSYTVRRREGGLAESLTQSQEERVREG